MLSCSLNEQVDRSTRCAGFSRRDRRPSRARRVRAGAPTPPILRLGRLRRGHVAVDQRVDHVDPTIAGAVGQRPREAPRPSSSSASAGRSYAAWDRGRHRRRRTAALRSSPRRARPVPFWRYGFAAAADLAAFCCQPCPAGRRPARATTTWWMRGTPTGTSKTSLKPTFTVFMRRPRRRCGPDQGAVRARHRALDQQAALVGVDRVDGEVLDGGAHGVGPAGHAQALEHPPGVAQAPIDPGERCLRWVPWLAPRPLNPCRFMTPAVPLPLLVPTTSTVVPGSNISAVTSWPSV